VDSKLFAEELRRQCGRFPSIASVCEGSRINRQQFNKYLSGKMLPSARSLRKICEFLGVSEEYLLTGGQSYKSQNGTAPATAELVGLKLLACSNENEMLALLATNRLAGLTGGAINSGVGVLQEGLYYCYFPLDSSPVFLRSLISVRKKSGMLSFVRRTYGPTLDKGRRYAGRGRHLGVVLRGPSEAYLLGVNRLAPFQLSFLTINLEPLVNDRCFVGLAITRKNPALVAMNIVIEYLGPQINPRDALMAVGPVSVDDDTLSPIIKLLCGTKPIVGTNQLEKIGVDDILRNSGLRTAAGPQRFRMAV
jgi:transcriptional regulator with XRE-family HTH domain